MLITAIEPRRKGLQALFLDGEFAVNVDAETLAASPFRLGKEIDDEQLHELLMASDTRRAKEKALYLLSHRDHSKKELVEKLKRAGTERAAEQTAQRMEEIGLVNDALYARRYAAELARRKGYAASRIEHELNQKGIDRELICEIIEEMALEPVKQITALLERKYARTLQEEKSRRRTVAALQRLGYRWEDIRRAIEEYAPGAGGEDDCCNGI